jgi:hypothetical protein
VYVPGKIICAPDFPYNVSIQNAIPHITMMLGEWEAVQSNDVLNALFGPGGPLQAYYTKLNTTSFYFHYRFD